MTTTIQTPAEVAAVKFAALVANAAAEWVPGNTYRTENDLFTVTTSARIDREPVGLVWTMYRPEAPFITPDGLSVGSLDGRRKGPANTTQAAQHVDRLEDGLIWLARRALGVPQASDGRWHELAAVVWSDGSWSWASFRWSAFQGFDSWHGETDPGTLYIQGPTGSTYLTVRFNKEAMRNPIW